MICLELGSGSTTRPSPWITSDLNPQSGAKMVIDVTQRFPFDDNSVDFVYSEHMIEHLSYLDGLHMLKECYRIMRPGGVCRIVTPSIEFLRDITNSKMESSFFQSYLQWSFDCFVPGVKYNPDTVRAHVFNGFVRNWGHTFISAHAPLKDAMLLAGFEEGILAWPTPIGFSNHKELCNMESINRLPKGYIEFESMIIEGIK